MDQSVGKRGRALGEMRGDVASERQSFFQTALFYDSVERIIEGPLKGNQGELIRGKRLEETNVGRKTQRRCSFLGGSMN